MRTQSAHVRVHRRYERALNYGRGVLIIHTKKRMLCEVHLHNGPSNSIRFVHTQFIESKKTRDGVAHGGKRPT